MRVKARGGGGALGPGPGGRCQRAESGSEVGGCVWVWPVGEAAAHPGVLREGLGEGAGPAAQPGPGPRCWQVSGALGWGWREVAERPRSRRAEEIGRGGPRAGQGSGTGVRAPAQSRSSTYLRGWKWAGMGRNTVPEVKTPAPSPGAGDVPEGNHSPSYHPLSPSPSAFRPRAPSPLLSSSSGGLEGGSSASHWPWRPRPQAEGVGLRAGREAGTKVWPEEETKGGVGEELKPTQAGKVRHDVMERNPYIQAPGRHLGLSRMEVRSRYVCWFSRVRNGFLAQGLRSWQLKSP